MGFSASIKTGERELFEGALRYAKAFKNKKGEDKFAIKVWHDLTEGLRLSDDDLQRIRWINACELLQLDPASVGAVAKPLVTA